MSTGWSIFIIVGTVISLIAFLWLLLGNRQKPTATVETMGHDFDGIQEYDNPLPMWWVAMFLFTIFFAVAFLVYYPGLGNFAGVGHWSQQDQWRRDTERETARVAPLYARLGGLSEEELHQDPVAQQIGRRLFLNHCSTCHGVTAQGAFGFPNLTDSEWLWGGDYADIQTTITQGRNAAMPAWGPMLKDAGVSDVVAYVRSLSGAEHDPAAATRGKEKFAVCVACHGADAKGNKLFGAPDLTNDIWLYGGEPEQLSFTITHGRNGHMPSFKDVLSKEQIHIVAGYVTSLRTADE